MGMPELLTIKAAAEACAVSRDTIKRRLRANQFPNASRAPARSGRSAPWLIPVSDLAEAGLAPAVDVGPSERAGVDPMELRTAVAHHEALAIAREAHLADLRTEVRRLHERVAHLTRLLEQREPVDPRE